MYKFLLNPFEKYSEKQLFTFGTLFLFIGSYIGFLCNAYFDSLLHITFIHKTTFIPILIQNTIIVLLLTLILFTIGKITNKKTRLIDVLNVSLIARIPIYLTTIININNATTKITDKLIINITNLENLHLSIIEYFLLLVIAIIGLISIIWFAYLLWNGFKTATNAKSNKPVILLILSLLIANYISNLLIHYIL